MANPVVTIDTTLYDTFGYAKLTFTNATKGANWYSWRVKRRLAGTTTWSLLKEYLVDQANYEYHDVTVPANTAVDYSVTRVHLVSAVPTEEADTPNSNITVPGTYYWIVHPTIEAKSLMLRNVTSDNYHDDFDFEVMRLIGRGRKVDQSSTFGVEGALSAQLRTNVSLTAAAQLAKLRTLKDSQLGLYLKTPFGQVWKVNLGQLDVTRIAGVGLSEFVDVSFPYSEVGYSSVTTVDSGGSSGSSDPYGGY